MLRGSCHCGRISFEVDDTFAQVMECNCSHCSRKGYLLWFVPRGRFRLLSGEDECSTHLFNQHAIHHHFCRTCGCAPFATGTSPAGVETAAVNIRCVEDVELTSVTRVPFDGRSR